MKINLRYVIKNTLGILFVLPAGTLLAVGIYMMLHQAGIVILVCMAIAVLFLIGVAILS